MLASKSLLIGSHTYHVTELPSGQARDLLVKLVKVFGPVLAGMLEDGKLIPEGTEGAPAEALVNRVSKVDSKTLSKMLLAFSDRVSAADFKYLCQVLGDSTQVEIEAGAQVPLDLEYQELHFKGGRLSHLFRWLAFALEVQYADFFPKPVTKPVSPVSGEKVS
jgi:hypothetical protein